METQIFSHLHIIYTYQAGSMPPPHHFEYKIEIGPNAAGKITFMPDYNFDNVPVWVEKFMISTETLERLIDIANSTGLFELDWKTYEESAIGGSQEWMEWAEESRQIKVPARLSPKNDDQIAPLYTVIRQIVPEDIWNSLWGRQRQYQDNYDQ